MKALKHIFQWLGGTIVAFYLLSLIALNLPFAQQWIAQKSATILSEELKTEVSIERARVAWNGRIVLDDVYIEDQQKQPMLKVTRASAKLNLWELFNKRIRIGHAQLFGVQAKLYQATPQTPINCQFIIDKFASNDTTPSKIDLQIKQVMIRRANISFDQQWQPKKEHRFSPHHVAISDLNLNLHIHAIKQDSLSIELSRLDFKEASGFVVKNMKGRLQGTTKDAKLRDFIVELPHSSVAIPAAHLQAKTGIKKFEKLFANIKAKVLLRDLAPFAGELPLADTPLHLETEINGNYDHLTARNTRLWEEENLFNLAMDADVQHPTQGKDMLEAKVEIQKIYASSDFVQNFVKSTILQNLQYISATGNADYRQGEIEANIDANTALGATALEGTYKLTKEVRAKAHTDGFNLGKIIPGSAGAKLGKIAFDAFVEGELPSSLNIRTNIPTLEYSNYAYHNIVAEGSIGTQYNAQISIEDENADLHIEGEYNPQKHTYKLDADIRRIAPNELHLTKQFEEQYFAGKVKAEVSGKNIDEMVGYAHVNDFTLHTPEGIYKPGDLHISSLKKEDEKSIKIVSPFLEAQANGSFKYSQLTGHLLDFAAKYLPTLVKAHEAELDTITHGNFNLKLYSAEPLRRLLGVDLQLPSPLIASGSLDAATRSLNVNASAPNLQYGKHILRNIALRVESDKNALQANAQLERKMAHGYLQCGLETQNVGERLFSRLYWNNHQTPTIMGDLNIATHLYKDESGKQAVNAQIQTSNFIIADTLWTLHPASVIYEDSKLNVKKLRVSSGERYLVVDGTASKASSDTLHAELHEISLPYIFNLVNFKTLTFGGKATGHAYAHSVFSDPFAEARLHVPDFLLNNCRMGDLDIYGSWNKRPYSIYLDGLIADDGYTSRVHGYITPKKDVSYHGLDLNVEADHVNLGFIDYFTSAILENLKGHGSGHARIFGPFKGVDLEGDVMINEASVSIPFTGVRYHIEEGDSIFLRPGLISFPKATAYDPWGKPGSEGHQGELTGYIAHTHFGDITYKIDVHGKNILGYDLDGSDGSPFYGTVFADGDVSLHGKPGECFISIKATPTTGTTFTYNMTSPDKLTETNFLTFVDRKARPIMEQLQLEEQTKEEVVPSSDLTIDFDLDLDKRATLNLLTDARSGDMISVNGYGHMLAHFFDKSSFQIFGTYHIEDGNYNLSLQEVIHKNFSLKNGGYLTFAGDPLDGDLHVQATHTVTGVSLNDLSPKANFSNTAARVKCLMNVTGKARQPNITFDFDIPNVNEDEKQMVRSLISTEEERNMQAIYLLGIGRFYAQDYESTQPGQNQGTMAVNSLLSSTLSGQINQILGNMIRNKNWSFGANLSTGELGWNDMNVEGMLQGSLLNNRLLLNGQFGYRDTPAMQNTFIGDFDVRYLLTRNGGIALKAYNETNDRYFTKSSLTTQGIGILLKRDFSGWRDLFGIKKRAFTIKENSSR